MYSETFRTVRIIRPVVSDRLRAASLQHLEKGGVPVASSSRLALSSALNNPLDENVRNELLSTIKRDAGLTIQVLRRIAALGKSSQDRLDPLGAIRSLPEQTLREVLQPSITSSGPHALGRGTPTQLRQLKHALTACTAAETIARQTVSTTIDSGAAFTTTFLRQIGSQMIAWNYPRIHARAVELMRHEELDLDRHFQKLLGISPRAIGVELARECHLPPETIELLQRRTTGSQHAGAPPMSVICTLGEAYAELQQPDLFRSAEKRWEELSPNLTILVGEVDQNELKRGIDESVGSVVEQLRSGEPQSSSRESTALGPLSARLLAANRFAQKTTPSVREVVERVYAAVEEHSVSSEALNLLVNELLPTAGFRAGAVFSFAPGRQEFLPIVRLRDADTRRYPIAETFSRRDFESASTGDVPLLCPCTIASGSEEFVVMAKIGSSDRRPGIFALELLPGVQESAEYDPILNFKAIRQCLYDCLKLQVP